MCDYQQWDKAIHALGYCEHDAVSNGLCAEHLAWVADCKAAEVSKIDQKYWYRVPAKRKAKLGPSSVVETILPPDPVGRKLYAAIGEAVGSKAQLEAQKAVRDYQNKKALEINAWRKPVERSEEDIQAGIEKLRAELAQAKADSDAIDSRVAAAAEHEVERRAAAWRISPEPLRLSLSM